MKTLEVIFHHRTQEFMCFDSKCKFAVFAGYGKTEEKAKEYFFRKQTLVKNSHTININYKGS